MNTLELAGGVIVTGFRGTEFDAELERSLRRVPFAGFILFARNLEDPQQARALTDALRAREDPPPIVAIDQEGGRIMRLRAQVEALPPMMALGAVADQALSSDAGEAIAYDLRRIGCTLDFAPVLDLAIDPRNTVIGTRAFGTSPDLVTRLGGAFARGLVRGGITPTFKHFPGHGATSFDTHLGGARLDADEATLRGRDLVPFQALARDADAIMAAHVAVPSVDDERPASLSRHFLTGVLREAWRYDGVVFTDCMQMDAIAKGIGTVRGVAEAIAAGADCALISHDPALAFEAARHLAEAVESGDVRVERLRQAHARVQRLRARAHAPIGDEVPAPHPGIGRRIARDAITTIRGVPRADAVADIAVIFGEGTLAAHVPVLEEQRVALDPDEREQRRMLETLAASNRRPLVLAHRAHLHSGQLRAIEAIIDRTPDALVVSTGEPYDVPLLHRARHLLAAYGNDEVSLAGLTDVIFHGVPSFGVLPVALA